MLPSTLTRIVNCFPHAELIPGGIRFWAVDASRVAAGIEINREWIDQATPRIVWRTLSSVSREMGQASR